MMHSYLIGKCCFWLLLQTDSVINFSIPESTIQQLLPKPLQPVIGNILDNCIQQWDALTMNITLQAIAQNSEPRVSEGMNSKTSLPGPIVSYMGLSILSAEFLTSGRCTIQDNAQTYMQNIHITCEYIIGIPQ